jgi:hypothetical protein
MSPGPMPQQHYRPRARADLGLGAAHLLNIIDTPGLSTCRKEALQRELSAVEAVPDKTDTNKKQD